MSIKGLSGLFDGGITDPEDAEDEEERLISNLADEVVDEASAAVFMERVKQINPGKYAELARTIAMTKDLAQQLTEQLVDLPPTVAISATATALGVMLGLAGASEKILETVIEELRSHFKTASAHRAALVAEALEAKRSDG